MMLEYKGYRGTYEPDQGLLTGHVIGIPVDTTFVGQPPAQLEEAFTTSIDDYLDVFAERGKMPALSTTKNGEQSHFALR
jgi:predicted HicB family RNase H-like nuclease